MRTRTWIPIALVAAIAAVVSASQLLQQSKEGVSQASLVEESETGLLIDFSLYVVGHNDEEVLYDTTNRAHAEEANRTHGRPLGRDSAHEPLFVPWTHLDRPRLVVEHALSKVDPALLTTGAKVDVIVEDAVGEKEDLIHGRLQRLHGPFPLYYELTNEQFLQATGREPTVGERVNTTALLVARVDAVFDDGTVRMRMNVENDQAIVSRTLASLFHVTLSEDGREFWLNLTPIRDSLFTVTTPNPALGLVQEGTYIWDEVTDEYVTYIGHPDVNPILVGEDYRLQVTVLKADARPEA